jgi:hypothetical protein
MRHETVSPQRQAEIDAGWADIAAQLNASKGLRTSVPPFDAAPAATPSPPFFRAPIASARQQAEIDAGWAQVVAQINREFGVRPPGRAKRA